MPQRQALAGKRLQRTDAAAALEQRGPEVFEREAEWTHHPHPRDHDAAALSYGLADSLGDSHRLLVLL
jgi:hypothetical protein